MDWVSIFDFSPDQNSAFSEEKKLFHTRTLFFIENQNVLIRLALVVGLSTGRLRL